jgi:hypothetical protein
VKLYTSSWRENENRRKEMRNSHDEPNDTHTQAVEITDVCRKDAISQDHMFYILNFELFNECTAPSAREGFKDSVSLACVAYSFISISQ